MTNIIKGRAWVLTNKAGALFDNIDTDMIFHNRYLAITELDKMGPYTFDNLEGWEDFARKAQPGDIVITGSNFGCGSSRQQAVDCFRALGVTALVCPSYGAIYFRNCVNTGWPTLISPDVTPEQVKNGEEVEINLENGTWRNVTRGADLPALKPVSDVQREIMGAGGLFKLRV